MSEALEHHEHAEHAATHGSKRTALLIAVLAALLAITEQQGRHAEIRVSINSILAADAWSQAKSTRQTIATDLSQTLAALEPGGDPAAAERRLTFAKKLQEDSTRFAKDPKDGKEAIMERAKGFEEVRNHSLEQSHSFDNASAALQLGIVLATASVIANSTLLIRFAILMGAIGVVLGVLGVTMPELGAF
jgi:hypothetical protein